MIHVSIIVRSIFLFKVIKMVQKLKRKRITKRKRIKTRRTRSRRRTQKGGVPLCIPCISPIAGALGLGTAVTLASTRTLSGKTSVKRNEEYSLKTEGRTIRKTFSQNNSTVDLAGKKKTYGSINEASKHFNEAVKRCIKNKFKKC
jgi:hypothetical protein